MTDYFKKRQGARAAGFARFFAKDESGVISVMAAFSLVMVIAIAAIVIDAGALMLTRRSLQNATDAAALSAAQHLPDGATAAVEEVLKENGFSSDDIDLVETGIYTADESKFPSDRFKGASDPSDPQINAVLVKTKAQAPTYFARALGLDNFSTVHTRAIAASMATASFSAGAGLLDLNEGLANRILGGLLGTNLSLKIANYRALAATNISTLKFLKALTSYTDVTAGSSFHDLLSANTNVGDIIEASIDVLEDSSSGATGDISQAIDTLKLLRPGPTALDTKINLSNLITVPGLDNRTIGGVAIGNMDNPELNLYDVVLATAQAAGAGRVINLGTSVPNLVNADVRVTFAPMGPQLASGPVGTSIHTSRIRVAINLQITDTQQSFPLLGALVATNISLPIVIEVGSGMGKIRAIPCLDSDMVDLSGSSGAVKIQYGYADDATLVGASSLVLPVTPIAAVTLLGKPVAQVTATGSATVAEHATEDLPPFSKTDIKERTIRAVPSSGGGKIIGNSGPGVLRTDIAVLPNLNLGILTSLLNGALAPFLTTVTNQLIATLGTLDVPVNDILRTLGIELGVIDLTVSGAKCGVPVLVG